jgi:hypothetical protein
VGLLVQVYDSPSSSSSVSLTLKKFHRSLSLLVFLPLLSVVNNTALCFSRYRWIFVAALLPQGVRLAWRFSVRWFSILLSLLSYEQYDQGWNIGREWRRFTSGSGVWAMGSGPFSYDLSFRLKCVVYTVDEKPTPLFFLFVSSHFPNLIKGIMSVLRGPFFYNHSSLQVWTLLPWRLCVVAPINKILYLKR